MVGKDSICELLVPDLGVSGRRVLNVPFASGAGMANGGGCLWSGLFEFIPGEGPLLEVEVV